ncbi:MAG TPA: 50S ribosomal protein L25 [Thermoanaerobaculia bacterium]|nr:50S ribosomal protein L25 [Thermoanaerobaculia bacterium]
MSEMTIEVERREGAGKNDSRRSRGTGKIPAVVYGGGKESVSILVNRKKMLELLKGKAGENPIFLLKMAESGQERHAMVRDIQVDPVSRQVIHMDFQRVLMTEKVRVQVPIELTGTAYGVKTQGGMLDFVTREVHIEALPADIPHRIELDVTELRTGQHVEASALQLPKGVTLLDEPERVIVSLTHGRTEDEAGEGSDRAEPEVIKKGKTDEA